MNKEKSRGRNVWVTTQSENKWKLNEKEEEEKKLEGNLEREEDDEG